MPSVTITGTTVAAGVPVYSFGGSDITLVNLGSIESTGNFAVRSQLAGNTVLNSGTIGSGNTQRLGIRMTAGGAVTNEAGGTITSGEAVNISGKAGTVVNAGVITSTNGFLGGVRLQAGGSVSNQAGGRIAGGQWGVYNNGGSAAVTNAAGGTITGGRGVSAFQATQVDNAGSIIGGTGASGAGVYLRGGGSVTNQAGGVISGARWGAFLYGSGVMDNAGAINSSDTGFESTGALNLTNRSTGVISGSTFGVLGRTGGTLVNQAGGTISGAQAIIVTSGSTSIENAGRIAGTAAAVMTRKAGGGLTLTNKAGGVVSGGVFVTAGGNVLNEAGGILSGATLAFRSLYTSATLTNHGTVSSGDIAVRMESGGKLVNQATGTITGDRWGVLSQNGSIENHGQIKGGQLGVRLFDSDTLVNHAGATIRGFWGIEAATGTSSIANAGHIQGLSNYGTPGLGVWLRANATLVNDATGTISGFDALVMQSTIAGVAMQVVNAGSITGVASPTVPTEVFHGVWMEVGTITNQASGVISGTRAIYGPATPVGTTGPILIDNAGRILGGTGVTYTSAAGIWLPDGGTVTNRAGGTISGDAGIVGTGDPITVANAGLIAGGTAAPAGALDPMSGMGVYLGAGGTLANQAGGSISGRRAVVAKSAAGTVTNAGVIAGTETGARLSNGARLTNQAGGTVSGGITGVVIETGGSVTNTVNGTITGATGVTGAGTIATAGRIIGTGGTAVGMTAGTANRLVVTRGAAFTGAVNGGNTLGSSITSTLQLTSSASAGTISGLGTTITNFERIQVDAGATWAMVGAFKGTVDTFGTISRTTVPALTFGAGFANRLILREGSKLVGTINGGNGVASTVQSTIQLTSLSSTGTLTGLGTQLTNFRRVEVDAGASWILPDPVAGTVDVAGTVAGTAANGLTMATGSANRVVMRGGATFNGVVKGGNTIGSKTVSTFELAGTGSVTGLTTLFTDFAAVEVGTGGDWTLLGATSIASGMTLTNKGALTNNGALTNAGQVRYGITLGAGASVTNLATGVMSGERVIDARYGSGATVVNAGRITGGTTAGGVGVLVGDSAVVSNAVTGTITGRFGIASIGTGAAIDNAGRILATATAGSRGISMGPGGSVLNRAGATISGDLGVLGGAATTIDTAGTIIGSGGTAVLLGAGFEHRLIVRPRAVFTGLVDGGNPIGETVVSTLQLAAGTVTGTLAGLGSQIVNFGAVDVDTGASWAFAGSSTVQSRLNNAGSIRTPVQLATGASVTNQAAGLIQGSTALDATEGAVTIANAGRLTGDAGSGIGVRLFAGGTISNSATGTISARMAVYGAPFGATTIVNAGKMLGNAASGWGVNLLDGGSISNQAGGTITGYYGVTARYLASDLTNAGVIRGNDTGGVGVEFRSGGTVTNQAGATIRAKQAIYGGASLPLQIINAGTVTGGIANGVGVRMKGGGTLTNQLGGTITGYNGVYASTNAAVIVNSGGIRGLGVAAFGAYMSAGGTVTNAGGGTIRGGIGVMINGGDGTVRNAGTIIGSLGTAVALSAGFANRVIVDPTGTFSGVVDGGNTIGSTIASTLQLAGTAASTLSGLGTQFVNFQKVEIDSGASWTVKATAAALGGTTITGSGGANALSVTTAGTVALAAVSGMPTIQLASGKNVVTLSDTTLQDGPVTILSGASGPNTIDASALTALSAGHSLTYKAGAGADTFIGGTSDDTIFAGTGGSNMTGGTGEDRMVFVSASLPAQTFTDFVSGEDSLLLYGIHAAGGFDLGATDNALDPLTPTLIDPTIFVSNATGSFTSADQRLAYSTTSGSLVYSATGSNVGAKTIAILTSTPTLTASDILFER